MSRFNDLLLCSAAALFVTSPALAQQALESDPTARNETEPALGDIVVTAQKRETSLQRTAIAMSAVSGDSLRDQQVNGIEGLAQSLPG